MKRPERTLRSDTPRGSKGGSGTQMWRQQENSGSDSKPAAQCLLSNPLNGFESRRDCRALEAGALRCARRHLVTGLAADGDAIANPSRIGLVNEVCLCEAVTAEVQCREAGIDRNCMRYQRRNGD